MKVCPKCKEKERYKNQSYCKDCQYELVRKYQKTEKGKKSLRRAVKKYQRKRNGFTEGIFEELFKIQGNVCGICKTDVPSLNNKNDWHGDHDHKTGRARGVLCAGCNTLLGRIESVGFDWVDKAKNYLNK